MPRYPDKYKLWVPLEYSDRDRLMWLSIQSNKKLYEIARQAIRDMCDKMEQEYGTQPPDAILPPPPPFRED